MLRLLSTSTPRSLTTEMLSSHSPPSLYPCPALFCLRYRIQRFPLLNFMLLLIAQCSNLFRSLYNTPHPFRKSTAPPSLSSASLLKMHSTPACRSLIKMLNRFESWAMARIEPWTILFSRSVSYQKSNTPRAFVCPFLILLFKWING